MLKFKIVFAFKKQMGINSVSEIFNKGLFEKKLKKIQILYLKK